MPERKYKSNKEELLAEGILIASKSNEAKYQHRVETVNLVLGGMVPSELSKYIKESKNTITQWVKIADEQGFEALKIKKKPGRPPKLSAEQVCEIKAVLTEDNSKIYGYNVWDGVTLSDYIKVTYNVDLCVRQCERLFHTMGFSLIRPQTYPSKNKDGLKDERNAFKKQ